MFLFVYPLTGFYIHPSEYHCQADQARSSNDEIIDSYSYTDNISERAEEDAYVRSGKEKNILELFS